MKIFIFLILVSIAAVIFYSSYFNDETDNTHTKQANTNNLVSELTTDPETEKATTIKPTQPPKANINLFDQTDFYTNPYRFVTRCGFEESPSWDISSEKAIEEYQKLSKKQLEAYSNLKAEKMCNAWYDYLSTVDDEQIEMLKKQKEEEALILDEFDALTSEEKADLAKDVLKNNNMKLKKRFALYHLLKSDLNFIKQVSKAIGTENLTYVSQSAVQVAILFECQNTPGSCTPSSGRMLTECLINEDNCGIDYYTYLERTRSQNEVNDFFNILDTARQILGI